MAKASDTAIDKFTRIRTLKCYQQVEEMLYAGYPVAGVASYIQDRMNEYRDVKRASLINMLKLFRQSLKESGMVHSTLPRVFVDAEKKFANKMRDLERLEDQYQSMQYRFDVLHAEERMTGKIDPRVDKIDKGMRETIRQMHAIKMDLGLVGSRDLGTITVSAERIDFIKHKYGDRAAEAFADPVSRGRVLAALGAIRRAGSLRNRDGSPMQISDYMKLTDEEAQVVDVEFEEQDPEYGAGEDDEGDGSRQEADGQQGPDWDAVREDFDKPDEGMDEVVEALDPEPEKEPDLEEDPEKREAVRAPPSDEVNMEPVRRQAHPGLPPGPMKPSVRGNVVSRTTSKQKRKKD